MVTATPLPSEMFVRRGVGVVETARVLAGFFCDHGEVAAEWVAHDSCPVPVEEPAGRVVPPASALCGEPVAVMMQVADADLKPHDLVVLEEDGVRVTLVVLAGCDHRRIVQALYRAALDRLDPGST